MKIYHNPRCSKSRQTLEIINQSDQDVTVVKYLESPPSKEELIEILHLLNIKPIQLVRKNEAIWKSDFKGKDLSDDAIIDAMLTNPKLIERPIVVHHGKAIIGRPPELVKSLF